MKKAKKELQNLKKEEQKLTNRKIKLELDKKEYEKELQNIKENTNKELENAETDVQVDFVLNSEQMQIDQLNNKYANQFTELDGINQQLDENKAKQEDISKNIDKINSKLTQTKNLENISDGLGNVNKSLTKTIKSVGRWALAVFGVRSAYMAVRSAASTLAQYNEQIGADLEYIKYALASALQPLIEKLISLAYTLLTYVNMISEAWFGMNLFANSSAKNMKKMASSAEKTKKSLTGFDEINKLEDNESASGGSTLPSTDLSNISDVPVPGWLQWIIDNKDIILSVLGGIATGLIAIKFGLDGISATGVFLFFTGLIYTILELISYFTDLDGSLENNGNSFQDFGNIIVGIGLSLAGLALAIGSLPLALGAAVAVIIGVLVGMWDTIKGGLQTAVDWISSKMDWIQEHFGVVGLAIAGVFQSVIEIVMHLFDGLFTGIKQIFDGILLIFKGKFKQGFINIGKGIVNAVIGVLNGLISGLNAIISPIRALIVGIGKVMGKSWTMDNIKIPTIKKLATGGIVDVPKTGVNIGGAIAGEAGAEGVLPLTNAETMSRLGQEIGKWITLNIDLTNSIDGRILNRRLETIKKENSFARNGG